MNRLNLTGRRTGILLRTVGQEKVVGSHVVSDLEVTGLDTNCFFGLPQEKRTLRVVFDFGATFQGTSLNDQLLQGPDLTSTLIGVITRFRKEPVVLMSDTESMFH